MDPPADVFRGVSDRFSGVTVDGRQEPIATAAQFAEKLQSNLSLIDMQNNR